MGLEQRVASLEEGMAHLMLSQTKQQEALDSIEKNTQDLVALFNGMQAAGSFLAVMGRILTWVAKLALAAGAIYAAYQTAVSGSWKDFLK
jgi:hypothetical protein